MKNEATLNENNQVVIGDKNYQQKQKLVYDKVLVKVWKKLLPKTRSYQF